MGATCRFCRNSFQRSYPAQLFCSLRCANRLHLNNKNFVTLPTAPDADLAEFFGIILGDGSVTQYYTKIYLNPRADAGYVPFVKKLSQALFPGASVTHQERPAHGTIEIQISAKDVCEYLRSIGFDAKRRSVPHWIANNADFVKATIRGLFDTEGSVGIKYFRGKGGQYFYKQLTVTNRNRNILRFLEKQLTLLGYRPTKNSEKNIYISNGTDIQKYVREIGSHNPKLVHKMRSRETNGFTYGGLRRMVRHQS